MLDENLEIPDDIDQNEIASPISNETNEEPEEDDYFERTRKEMQASRAKHIT